jgi:UDP:flavonoid glycosyltransferase YjiC (YdhE family)
MSRFLFGWEFGGGLGHLGHMLPVARSLQSKGHACALALRDLRVLAAADPGPDIPVLQAPICQRNYPNLAEPPLNYAEILMRFGYLDADVLSGLVKGWRALAQTLAVDFIVADHAPTAMMAARTLGLGCAVLANPFVVPPLISPTPNMRSWLALPEGRLASSDKSVLTTINTVFNTFNTPPIEHLFELFDVDDIVLASFRELDQFPRRPEADLKRMVFCGPILSTGAMKVDPPWPPGKGKRIFAYLKPDYLHLAAILNALAASGQPCVIYGLGANSDALPVPAPNLAFSPRPIDVIKAGQESALGVCHSGSTTAAALLQAGVPQLLLPMHLEQFLVGVRVAELGAGLVINPEEKQPDIAGGLGRLLCEPHFAERAAEFAARYRDLSPDKIVASAVARLLSAAGRKRTKIAGRAK